MCIVMPIVGCSATTEPSPSALGQSALKTIDPESFRAVVAAKAQELMVPGALVLLRTPKGSVTASVGTTELGARTPPEAKIHFRIASNTKTMAAASIVLLAQDGKLKFSDPVANYVPGVPNGEHHRRRAFEDAQRTPRLHRRSCALGGHGRRSAEGVDARGGVAIAFRHPPQFAPDASYE